MTVLGIDEAGRGPVLGSMFVGAVMVDPADMDALAALELKDSKVLNDDQREAFVPQIEELAVGHQVREVTASEIDELREIMSLNIIEINAFVSLIEGLTPKTVYIDLPERNSERFEKKIRAKLPETLDNIEIIAEHKADDTYPIVSAASILAKSAREAHMAELSEKYGCALDSGYPHDSATTEFLAEYLADHGELPPETRESWATAKRIRAENEQQGLADF